MNDLRWLLDAPALPMVGLALLHFLWQGAALAACAALLLIALRKASASTRYLALLMVVVLMTAAPVATYLVLSRPRPATPGSVRVEAGAPRAPRTVGVVPPMAAAPQPVSPAYSARPRPSVLLSTRALLPWVAVLWATGVVLLSLRLMLRWRGVSQARRTSAELAGERWAEMMETLRQRLRVTRAVRLLESAVIQVPSVVGWLQPVILLPATALSGLNPEQWQAILAHELAHVRRGDYLVNLAQSVVETLLFYHPAVWWVSGRIRLEREHCCDELAVAACGDAVVYMEALAEMEQLRGIPEPALGVRGSSLVRRVRHLTGASDGGRNHLPQRLAGVVALILIVASGVGLCLACGAPRTEESREPVSEADRARVAAPDGQAQGPAPGRAHARPRGSAADHRSGGERARL